MADAWNVEETAKLERWWKTAATRRDAHFRASSLNNTLNKGLELPSIVVGSITSTIALQPREDGLVAYLSIFTTTCMAVNTFMRFGGKAAEHMATSKAYGSLARSIESAVLRREAPSLAFTEYIVSLSEQFDEVAKARPALPMYIRARLNGQNAQLPTVFGELRGEAPEAEDEIAINVVT